jgi:hypothetical protein
MHNYMSLMGKRVRDRVTKIEGVVTSVSFDLYGCVQVVLTPGVNNKDGKLGESFWMDWKRLETLSTTPVMPVPSYAGGPGSEAGAADKPRR